VLTTVERRMVRQIWREIRGPGDMGARGGAAGISALNAVKQLAPSLESLVRQGYAQNDIGEMFGVSGSTVARWCKALGLRPSGMSRCARVWSDEQKCFVATRAITVPSVALKHCHAGHLFTKDNTRLRGEYRWCRECDALRARRYRARVKAAFHA